MNSLENDLHCLETEKDKEVNTYLSAFIGLKYGLWPFDTVIRNHEDVYKFFRKHPNLHEPITAINDKYHRECSILIHEHGRNGNRK